MVEVGNRLLKFFGRYFQKSPIEERKGLRRQLSLAGVIHSIFSNTIYKTEQSIQLPLVLGEVFSASVLYGQRQDEGHVLITQILGQNLMVGGNALWIFKNIFVKGLKNKFIISRTDQIRHMNMSGAESFYF